MQTTSIHVGIPQTPATPTGMSNSPGNVTLTLSTAESGTETSTEFFKFTVKAERVANGDVSLHLRSIENYTDGQAVEVAIGGLVGDEEYRFSVRASNSLGSSSFSENSQAIRVLGEIRSWLTSVFWIYSSLSSFPSICSYTQFIC